MIQVPGLQGSGSVFVVILQPAPGLPQKDDSFIVSGIPARISLTLSSFNNDSLDLAIQSLHNKVAGLARSRSDVISLFGVAAGTHGAPRRVWEW